MLSILRSVLRFELRLVEWGLLAGLITAPYLAAGLAGVGGRRQRPLRRAGRPRGGAFDPGGHRDLAGSARLRRWLRAVMGRRIAELPARVWAVATRPVSVAALAETVFWLAIPYLLIGLSLVFLQPDHLTQVRHQLQLRAPQSTEFDLVAMGLATVLWPALLVSPVECPH